jgi:hypothetical protein
MSRMAAAPSRRRSGSREAESSATIGARRLTYSISYRRSARADGRKSAPGIQETLSG